VAVNETDLQMVFTLKTDNVVTGRGTSLAGDYEVKLKAAK
jgi:hypothetical protein